VADNDPILSAEVLLHPVSHRSISDAVITAQNVKDFAPSPDDVDIAQQFFSKAGFHVGGLAGIGFSITARKSAFERLFNVQIQIDPDGSAKVLDRFGGASIEFPLNALPVPLNRIVAAITFSRPLNFGPSGNFSY
jgi:hypothetical protein